MVDISYLEVDTLMCRSIYRPSILDWMKFFTNWSSLDSNLNWAMEGTSTEEFLLTREIEDLDIVNSLSFIHTIRRDKTGYRVNLFCNTTTLYGGWTDGGCTVTRVGPILMSTKRPTQSDCLRVLGDQIRQDHDSDCVTVVEAWQAVSSAVESTGEEDTHTWWHRWWSWHTCRDWWMGPERLPPGDNTRA